MDELSELSFNEEAFAELQPNAIHTSEISKNNLDGLKRHLNFERVWLIL